MAPLAGLLIEYLVVGAVASIWLGPYLLDALPARSDAFHGAFGIASAALVPALYVAGMICDLLGSKLLHDRKKEIEDRVRDEAQLGKFSAQRVHALATAYAPDLVKEIEKRSTRDRIARGSLVASLPMLWFSPFEGAGRLASTTITVVVIITLYQLWHRMQTLSAKYEVEVVRILRAKFGVKVE